MTRRFRRRVERGERGAALVEFALLVPVLMMLFLGIITGGISYSRKISMTNAVREGARFGATLESSATWASSVRTRVRELAATDLQDSEICVLLLRDPATVIHQDPVSCPFAGQPANPADSTGTCLVKVWAQRPSEMEWFFASRTVQLKASSVSRYERVC